MNQENIISKIRKVLARADDSRNDNEHEREIAMRQATAMLAKHGLTLSEIGTEIDMDQNFGVEGQIEFSVGKSVWMSMIYHNIAKLYGCTVLRSPGRSGQTIYIIGRSVRCTIARQTADYVISSIKRESTRAYRDSDQYIAARSFHTNFGVGASSSIRIQVAEILKAQAEGQLDGEHLSPSQALIVVNQHKMALVEADKLVTRLHGRTTTSSYSSSGGDGRSQGQAFGRNVSLNSQISGKTQRALT